MTTAKEVKELVAPLLARHPEMTLVGKAVIVGPVRHLMHIIYIDRTSSADVCQPHWGVDETFFKHEEMSLGTGDRLHGLWRISDANLPQRLIKDVEEIALPKLAAIRSIRDYMAFAMPSEAHRRAWASTYVEYLLVLGDLEIARDVLASDERVSKWWFPRLDNLGIRERLMSLGNQLDAADRAKLAGLFHEWEAYTVHKLKIAHLWEQTPFPLEQMVTATAQSSAGTPSASCPSGHGTGG